MAGPPFNKSIEEIGWFTNYQIQMLFLRHRNISSGILDIEAVMKERRVTDRVKPVDWREDWRKLRRIQEWPEYKIDREIRKM